MRPPAKLLAGAGLLVAALAGGGAGPAPAAGDPQRQCFRAMDWQGATSAGPRDLFIRVGLHDVWHIGLAEACLGATYPGRVRVNASVIGSNWICQPADLQIAVAPAGFSTATPCTVDELHKLTPEEAKELPRKIQP